MLRRGLQKLGWLLVVTGSFAAGSSTACSGKKNTELVIAVQTDLRVPKDLNAVTIRVLSFGAVYHENTYEVGPGGLKLPATIGVIPEDSDDLKPVDIQIIGRYSANADPALRTERVIRKARLTFAKDHVGLVRLPIRFSCYDKQGCTAEETCIAGACETIPVIDGASLPEYTADQVFGVGASGEGEVGECWDAERCLPQSARLGVTSEPCVFSLATFGADAAPGSNFKRFEPGTAVTIVIATPATATESLGLCSGGICRIALDQDPVEGWDFANEQRTAIKLARGLCTRMAEEKSWTIEATDGCPTKTASLPLCPASTSNVGDTSVPGDGAVDETAIAPDTSVADSATVDSSVAVDTTPLDTTPLDTSAMTPPDASAPDSSVPDASLQDTTAADTSPPPSDTSTCTPRSCAELSFQCGFAKDNCGADIDCGPCAAGTCSGNTCIPDTDSGSCSPLSQCGGQCVNTSTNALHCGQCFSACPGGWTCNNSTCQAGGDSGSCGGSLVFCGAQCVDLSTNHDYCGDCFTPCTAFETCVSGSCQPQPDSGPADTGAADTGSAPPPDMGVVDTGGSDTNLGDSSAAND